MRLVITAIILSLVLFGCSDEKNNRASVTQQTPKLETIGSSPEAKSQDDIPRAEAPISSRYDAQSLVRMVRELRLSIDMPPLNQQIDGFSNNGRYGDCVDFVNLPLDSRLASKLEKDPILENIRVGCGSRFLSPNIFFRKTSDRYFEIHNLNFIHWGMLTVNLLARDRRITGIEVIDIRKATSSYTKKLRAILSNGAIVSKDDKFEYEKFESSRLEVVGNGYHFKLVLKAKGRYHEASAKITYHLPEDEGSVLEMEDVFDSDTSKKTCRILVKKDKEILFSEHSEDKNCNFTSSSHSIGYL